MTHAPGQVDVETARRLLDEGALLVDVRELGEVSRLAYDHPQVVSMPLSEFERRHLELPHDRPLIMACASGGRSLQAMQYLLHRGHSRVLNLQGGIASWRDGGQPVRGPQG